MTETEGRFLVTHAEEESAVLKDVDRGQVHTLGDNPGVEEGDLLEGAVAPEPPMEVTYELVDVEDRRTVPVEIVDLEPTAQAKDIAADQPVGELTTRERAGEGELHILTVDEDGAEQVAQEVVADEETVARAGRLGVDRVEVRTAEGVVSVRYLPD